MSALAIVVLALWIILIIVIPATLWIIQVDDEQQEPTPPSNDWLWPKRRDYGQED